MTPLPHIQTTASLHFPRKRLPRHTSFYSHTLQSEKKKSFHTLPAERERLRERAREREREREIERESERERDIERESERESFNRNFPERGGV